MREDGPPIGYLFSRRILLEMWRQAEVTGANLLANNAFERSGERRGRAVLAMDCVLGGAERAPCLAAQQDR
jgi:hypothetical protein